MLSCVVRFKVFCARNPLYAARNVRNRNLVSVHCCLSTVCSTRTLGMWHCAVCQLGPTLHTRLLLRLPSSTHPLRSPRSSPQRLNPNNLYFPMPRRASAFPRSPVEWNSNVGWDEIDTLYVAPHLAHTCSPSFLHSYRLPFSPYPIECLRLPSPCCRQVNFRSCTVIATNYGRSRAVEQG